MKYNKLFFLGVVLLGLAFTSQAQSKYAVINTKYILDRIPEYKEADKKLKALGDQWQQEIDEQQMILDKMYKNYEAEQFMLSEDLRKKREDELFMKEKALRDLQKSDSVTRGICLKNVKN
jgi:outer membrane protein